MSIQTAATDPKLPLGTQEFALNPYPWFERLRNESPLYINADGIHFVTRYEDVVNLGRSPSITIINPHATAFNDGFEHTVLGLEPPEHTKVRTGMNKWLSPKLCEEWVKAGLLALNAELDRYVPGEVIDGHHRLGIIPTHAAMCRMLQVPTDEPEPAISAMLDVMRGASAVATSTDNEKASKAFAYLRTRVLDLIEYKKKHPGDGLADSLMAAEASGEISTEVMLQTFSLFWASGAHNPSYMIGAALELFATRPEIYEEFRAHPEKQRAIINELLRLYPAEFAMTRYAAEDFEMLGKKVPKGTQIRFMLNSANRDPSAFPNPNDFDAGRPVRPPHVTFSVGHHGCAGTVLARMEGERLLGEIARRVRRIEMAGKSKFDATDRSIAYVKQYLKLEMA